MATPETPGAAIFLYKNKCFRNDLPGPKPPRVPIPFGKSDGVRAPGPTESPG